MISLKKVEMGLLILSLLTVLSVCSCKDNNEQSSKGSNAIVSILGSLSVGPLAEKLAHKYSEQNNTSIEINKSGSFAGITKAISGVSGIGMSSRDLKEEEIVIVLTR